MEKKSGLASGLKLMTQESGLREPWWSTDTRVYRSPHNINKTKKTDLKTGEKMLLSMSTKIKYLIN